MGFELTLAKHALITSQSHIQLHNFAIFPAIFTVSFIFICILYFL